jgi:hypothetical protein
MPGTTPYYLELPQPVTGFPSLECLPFNATLIQPTQPDLFAFQKMFNLRTTESVSLPVREFMTYWVLHHRVILILGIRHLRCQSIKESHMGYSTLCELPGILKPNLLLSFDSMICWVFEFLAAC